MIGEIDNGRRVAAKFEFYEGTVGARDVRDGIEVAYFGKLATGSVGKEGTVETDRVRVRSAEKLASGMVRLVVEKL